MTLAKTYYDVKNSKKRFCVNQGGTRSGKTYSILCAIIEYCFTFKNAQKTITICRKTFPALRGSVYRDFIQILQDEGYYSEDNHNKMEAIYYLFGNQIEFLSIDQAQKIRGRKRNILFVNECNELNWEDFFQLNIRTTDKVILDYNPSEDFWIDKIKDREDSDFFITTYKDNPFLGEDLINEIERLKEIDENYWQIYGLGLPGLNEDLIFSKVKYVDKIPDEAELVSYGLDFGYSISPTAVVSIHRHKHQLYLNEVLHKTGLTNQDLADELKHIVGKEDVICDSAEPKSIEELYRMGINAKPCRKGGDGILNGIDILRRYELNVIRPSENLMKEFRNYKWKKDKNNQIIKEPIKRFDHFMDAIRYVALIHLKEHKRGWYAIR